MTSIHILTTRPPIKRISRDYYPLERWKRLLIEEGINIKYVTDHKSNQASEADIIILDYRYIQDQLKSGRYADKDFIIDFLHSSKQAARKLILFDTNDSSGSRCFEITPHVDIHMKKQILKDRTAYLDDNGDRSVMPWITEDHTRSTIPYTACRSEDLPKLRIAWNIGMVDYRFFPWQRCYPVGTSTLGVGLYNNPVFTTPAGSKEYLATFRGGLNEDTRYSFQRKLVRETLIKMKDRGRPIAVGNAVSRRKYRRELAKSKVVVSPFGWGEICYRDFECFLAGAILVKPNMSHLETYPNMYVEGETYLSTKWDMSDLDTIIAEIDEDYDAHIAIAEHGQKLMKRYLQDGSAFVSHFCKTVLE